MHEAESPGQDRLQQEAVPAHHSPHQDELEAWLPEGLADQPARSRQAPGQGLGRHPDQSRLRPRRGSGSGPAEAVEDRRRLCAVRGEPLGGGLARESDQPLLQRGPGQVPLRSLARRRLRVRAVGEARLELDVANVVVLGIQIDVAGRPPRRALPRPRSRRWHRASGTEPTMSESAMTPNRHTVNTSSDLARSAVNAPGCGVVGSRRRTLSRRVLWLLHSPRSPPWSPGERSAWLR